MSFILKFRSYYVSFLLLLILILFAFKDLGNTFFQQDEWLGLGQIKAYGWESVTHGFNFIQLLFGDGRPLTRILGVLLFANFGFNFNYFAFYSIILHFVSSVLVLLIARKLLRNKFASFVSAAFFSVNSVSHQGVSWFGASFGGLPSAVFILLSIYCILNYIDAGKTKYLYISFFAAIVSLYFKESGIFLFILLPVMPLIFNRRINFSAYVKKLIPFGVFISLFTVYRIYQIFFSHINSRNLIEGSSVYLTSANNEIILTIILRIILYPLTSLTLIFIPSNIASIIAFAIYRGYYPYIVDRADLVVYTSILDAFSMFVAFIVIASIYFIWKLEKKLRGAIYFFLAFFALSFIPYLLISKSYSYLEPRYYYIASSAAGILLGIYVCYLAKNSKKIFTKVLRGLFYLFLIALFAAHIKTIHTDLNYQVILAEERKSFLNQLSKYKNTLNNDKNVFYFSGDKAWLVDGNRTPFQHGFGYSLLVMYYESGKIPKSLLASEYLFALGEQGYRTVGDFGFGYFYNIKDLELALKKYKFSKDDIHAFYYYSKTGELRDITTQTRNRLSAY